ncbi:MAG: hypothetical protein FWD58_06275 [Firmicutes bacterium]|nr:hypothetical protein [Bacillota bacterium]
MEIIESGFFGSNANAAFGNSPPLFGSHWLEATLRYIAAKQCGGDISALRPLRIYNGNFTPHCSGNEYLEAHKGYEANLFILSAQYTNIEMPVITADGWEALNKPPFPVANFLSQAAPTAIYVHTEKQKVFVFVNKPNEVWTKGFTASLVRVLRWIYGEKAELSTEEKALFKAVNEEDKETFIRIINALSNTLDFRSWRIKKELFGWNNSFRNARVKKLGETIQGQTNTINTQERTLNDLRVTLENYKTELDALINAAQDNNSELGDFISSHRQLNITKVKSSDEGNTLTYTIIETIDYYDQDAFLTTYKNKRSYIHDKNVSAEARYLFYGIFALSKGSFRVEASFELKNFTAINPVTGVQGEYNSYTIPHPHLATIGCLGGNRAQINDCLKHGNWDLAIEQTIAAAKNINFGDHGVVNKFFIDVAKHYMNVRCIVADNGKEMTPREFLSYIQDDIKDIKEETTNGQ